MQIHIRRVPNLQQFLFSVLVIYKVVKKPFHKYKGLLQGAQVVWVVLENKLSIFLGGTGNQDIMVLQLDAFNFLENLHKDLGHLIR